MSDEAIRAAHDSDMHEAAERDTMAWNQSYELACAHTALVRSQAMLKTTLSLVLAMVAMAVAMWTFAGVTLILR